MLNSLKGLLSRKNDVPSPTVISLGQVWVDIMMDIDAIPQPGGFAVANHTMPSVGGSFRVMQAASRIGAATKHAGVIGNGPWASLIRKALNDNGIEHIGQDRIDADSGFRLVPSQHPSKECAAIKRYLDANYSEDITLDTLSQLSHLNKYYLSHEFTKYYGISPINYLNQRRIDVCKELLENSDYDISDIAHLTGFSSQSYLSQSFRRYCNTTAGSYRREAKKKKKETGSP